MQRVCNTCQDPIVSKIAGDEYFMYCDSCEIVLDDHDIEYIADEE